MPILIILGILFVYFIIWLKDKLTPPHRAYTLDELTKMGREMTGKSHSESGKIIRRYDKYGK